MLAGKPAGALPFLRKASTNCFILEDPFTRATAEIDLARALEQTGSRDGACEAFGKVLERWGRATPKSLSADAAREGVKRLRCGK
jgi:serine/threonine-protein kinase